MPNLKHLVILRTWETSELQESSILPNTDCIVLGSFFLPSERLPHHLNSLRNKMALLGLGRGLDLEDSYAHHYTTNTRKGWI